MRINKEGYKIIIVSFLILGIISAGCFLLFPSWVGWIICSVCVLFLLFTLYFFRDPKRSHQQHPELAYSPADGKIVAIETVEETEFLKSRCLQISVFMSLTNVHANWYPVAGEVVYAKYHPGKFLVAWHPKSSEENERTTTVVDTGKERVLFRQIAGMVARRIVCYAKVGDKVSQSDRLGFIKFGSRVDVFLPPESVALVKIGDKVTAAQTPLARLARD